ncbi:aldo/keto reductase [Alloscardovia criceti]|uniref:aldo/keto reductase n=1 Tax=Alloscardovia criceti TaxID=356828 RepID=UPI000360668B|nr:aldo/keto reductase [Alloscardovia criceti]
MKRTELTPGYSISRVLNGLWQLSDGHTLHGQLDIDDVKYAFAQLVDHGFTTFDLADIYGPAENVLGEFLADISSADSSKKDSIQIHEKYVPDYKILTTVQFSDTERIIDRSLKKLGRDYIDLIQYHWWDYDINRYIEVAQNLVKLQEKGKIRHIGVTNFDTAHLKQLVDAGIPVISCQSQYSLLDRRVEKAMIEYGKQAHIAQICYGTLAGGYFTDKYRATSSAEAQPPLTPQTRSQVKYAQIIDATVGEQGYRKMLDLLHDIARKQNTSIAQIASRYILEKEGVAAVIIGIRNSRHVDDNAKIFDFELSHEDIASIDHFLSTYSTVEGEPYELERDPHSIFRSIIRMNEAEK